MPEAGSASQLKSALKAQCLQLNFDAVGIARADPLVTEAQRFKDWIAHGYAKGMPYLERNPASRFDPKTLLPGCRSVIVLAQSIYIAGEQTQKGLTANIARYAKRDDYHDVVIEKLRQVAHWLDGQVEDHRYKATVDMSPISEKAFAVKAGVGWRGKNSLVVNQEFGSFFVIGLILTTAELEQDTPVTEYCGSCTKCIDACPVDALVEPGVLNASRCISFHTTGRKGDPAGVDLAGRLFGCDICQDVCPYNSSPKATTEPRFSPREGLERLDLAGLVTMSPEDRIELLSGTAMADYGVDRLVETAKVLLNSKQ